MRTIEHWIAGKRDHRDGQRAPAASGTRPPASSRPRCCSRPRRTSTRRSPRPGTPSPSWSQSSLSTRTQGAVRASASWSTRNIDRARRGDHRRARQGALRRARARCSAGSEVVEFACGIPQLLKGEYSDQVSTGVDSYSFRQPLGVVAGITPFNFPVDGADVDAPGRHRLRQHVRAQAERARPVGASDPGRRAVGRGRAARRRLQRRARRQGGGRRAARPPGRRRGVVRRLDPDRAVHPRAGHRDRQAGAGARRRQEPRGRPARTPTSTSPPTTWSPRPSGRPASAAWRSRPSSRSAASADALVEKVNAKARADQGRLRPRRRRARWARSSRAEARDRIVGLHRRRASSQGAQVVGRRPRARRRRATRTASSSARPCIDHVTPEMDVYTRRDLRAGAVGAARRRRSTRRSSWSTPTPTATAPRSSPPAARRRARFQRGVQRRHDRHQRADPGADGLLLLRRLEGLAVRRPPHPRPRRGRVLHPRQGRHDPLAARRASESPRPSSTSRRRTEARPPASSSTGAHAATAVDKEEQHEDPTGTHRRPRRRRAGARRLQHRRGQRRRRRRRRRAAAAAAASTPATSASTSSPTPRPATPSGTSSRPAPSRRATTSASTCSYTSDPDPGEQSTLIDNAVADEHRRSGRLDGQPGRPARPASRRPSTRASRSSRSTPASTTGRTSARSPTSARARRSPVRPPVSSSTRPA